MLPPLLLTGCVHLCVWGLEVFTGLFPLQNSFQTTPAEILITMKSSHMQTNFT